MSIIKVGHGDVRRMFDMGITNHCSVNKPLYLETCNVRKCTTKASHTKIFPHKKRIFDDRSINVCAIVLNLSESLFQFRDKDQTDFYECVSSFISSPFR